MPSVISSNANQSRWNNNHLIRSCSGRSKAAVATIATIALAYAANSLKKPNIYLNRLISILPTSDAGIFAASCVAAVLAFRLGQWGMSKILQSCEKEQSAIQHPAIPSQVIPSTLLPQTLIGSAQPSITPQVTLTSPFSGTPGKNAVGKKVQITTSSSGRKQQAEERANAQTASESNSKVSDDKGDFKHGSHLVVGSHHKRKSSSTNPLNNSKLDPRTRNHLRHICFTHSDDLSQEQRPRVLATVIKDLEVENKICKIFGLFLYSNFEWDTYVSQNARRSICEYKEGKQMLVYENISKLRTNLDETRPPIPGSFPIPLEAKVKPGSSTGKLNKRQPLQKFGRREKLKQLRMMQRTKKELITKATTELSGNLEKYNKDSMGPILSKLLNQSSKTASIFALTIGTNLWVGSKFSDEGPVLKAFVQCDSKLSEVNLKSLSGEEGVSIGVFSLPQKVQKRTLVLMPSGPWDNLDEMQKIITNSSSKEAEKKQALSEVVSLAHKVSQSIFDGAQDQVASLSESERKGKEVDYLLVADISPSQFGSLVTPLDPILSGTDEEEVEEFVVSSPKNKATSLKASTSTGSAEGNDSPAEANDAYEAGDNFSSFSGSDSDEEERVDGEGDEKSNSSGDGSRASASSTPVFPVSSAVVNPGDTSGRASRSHAALTHAPEGLFFGLNS